MIESKARAESVLKYVTERERFESVVKLVTVLLNKIFIF